MLAARSSLKKRNRHGKKATKAVGAVPEVDQRVLDILTGAEEKQSNLNSTVQDKEASRTEHERAEPSARDRERRPEDGRDERTKRSAEVEAEQKVQRAPELHGWPNALPAERAKNVKVTVLLENANLETVRQGGRGGGVALLNSDDHRHVLRKTGRNANDARPDITHQCLLTLLDSPLNKEGRLKVYVRTSKKVLIDVNSETRIPRTFTRFAGLMAELLEKLKVRGTSGNTPLLRVIRNPIVSHLAVGTRKVVCTYNTDNVVDIRQHSRGICDALLANGGEGKIGDTQSKMGGDGVRDGDGEEVNILYVVGAMAHGKIEEEWADEYMCISEYPLSAATVCSRITHAYECLLGIL